MNRTKAERPEIESINFRSFRRRKYYLNRPPKTAAFVSQRADKFITEMSFWQFFRLYEWLIKI
jgi:hypothetical protein